MGKRNAFPRLTGLLAWDFPNTPQFHVLNFREFLALKENNEIEEIRVSVPDDEDVMIYEVKVFDGNGVLKKVIPSITYGEWKKKKIISKTPRQWAYWSPFEKEQTS